MYRVELLNISKSYGGIAALKNVTLKVNPGEIHALVGENGAGKSTLMKILSGAVSRDDGRIVIDGQEAIFNQPMTVRNLALALYTRNFHWSRTYRLPKISF